MTVAGLLLVVMAGARAQLAGGPLGDTLERVTPRLPPVGERLERRVDDQLETVEEERQRLEEELPLAEPGAAANEALQTAEELAASGTVLVGAGANLTGNTAGQLLRPFVPDVDPFGYTVEKNVLVVLVDSRQLAAARASGLEVVAQRELPGLGLVLVTLRAQNGYALAQKALQLRQDIPDAAVDFNHLYRFQQQQPAQPAAVDGDEDASAGVTSMRIGLIDSAVQADHPVLRGHAVERRDFVSHEAGRPLGHGTAVASLLLAASGDSVEILSASVFFQLPKHAPGASTESLVAALDWLAAEQVDAINMSLAGPENDLLERALRALADNGGPTVVAAVGNNGPSGEPMYPGAYATVLGVTAVDRDAHVFRYANRGEHVDFAARGVNVKVADAGAGWRIESGTSMAAPRIAVYAAALRRAGVAGGDEVSAMLAAGAKDLGEPGFDPVFGHGLLSRPPEIHSQVRTSQED